MASERIKVSLHRPLHADGLWVAGEVLVAFDAPWSSDLVAFAVRVSVSSAPAVVAAAMYRFAPDLLLLTSRMVAGVGSGGCWSGQGCCCGGGDLEVEFLPWFRRRDDACSGVVAEPRGLHRSFLLAAAWWLARLDSSSFSGVGEGDYSWGATFSRLAGLQTCWHGEAEDDDFPPAISSAEKRFRRPGGRGGGGGEARPRLAPALSAFRGPGDHVVISSLCGVRCNVGC